MQPNVLLVDDDHDAVLSLARALKAHGLDAAVHAASTPEKARELFRQYVPQVVVLDLCLDAGVGIESGFGLLSEFSETDSDCRIIVLTGHGGVEHGVRALRCGAGNFLEKPAEIDHLKALIHDGVGQSDLKRAYRRIQGERQSNAADLIVGESEPTLKLRADIMACARTNQAVLLTGETGTGKGLCAQVLHKLSARSSRAFVRYQPYFGTADMVASDLFGHVKGAFTGAYEDRRGLVAEAHLGTLFLDEVDELPTETQVTLLGVLQEKRFRALGANREQQANFRLITASNRNIEECLSSGKLRQDLYHRIAHAVIAVPPLRERRADIGSLAVHTLARLRESERVNVYGLNPAAAERLEQYGWPGNVRELQGAVEGAAFRAQAASRSEIGVEDLQLGHGRRGVVQGGFNEQVEQFKQELVRAAMQRSQGNQVQAARDLGIDRWTLRRIIARA